MDEIIKKHLDEFIKNSAYPTLNYTINLNKNHDFGDFSTNLCFVYAKQLKKDPKEIAKELITFLIKHYPETYKNIEFAAPGFVNFYLKTAIDYDLIKKIILQDELYPTYDHNGQKINVEFVSANPTGKLHLAHAYAAIFGQALVNCFIQLGYFVQKEFYINDAGHQIDLLALSVLIRYLNLFDKNLELPEDAYHGEEIIECANALKTKYGNEFVNATYTNDGISDQQINEKIKLFAKDYMLKQIQLDLQKVDVNFDLWTSEKQLYESKEVDKVIADLKKLGQTYEKDGALWLKSTAYGDDKDRVLQRSNGLYTYLVPDIALHVNKILRGFDYYYNIWGMDHDGYIPRLKIALKMLGFKQTFEVICLQVMKLEKDGQEFKLSKRAGTSLTLDDLVSAIGKDELKWICTSFKTNTHKTIDVNKITKHDNDNPLFYVEYACARLFSIFKKHNFVLNKNFKYHDLNEPSVIAIAQYLAKYDGTLHHMAKYQQTQVLNTYLYELATKVHEFYNELNLTKVENESIRLSILHILYATRIILRNGLAMLGIKAYEEM